ncbi:hypothetical protein ACFHWW_34400, partial [Ensifer sp. P24N7]
NSNEAPGAPVSAEARPIDPINAGSVDDRADDVDVARAATAYTDGAEVEISKHHEVDHPAEVVGQVQERRPASQARTTSTGTPRKRAKQTAGPTIAYNSKVGHEDRKAQSGTVENTIFLDELAALEEDNKRLK